MVTHWRRKALSIGVSVAVLAIPLWVHAAQASAQPAADRDASLCAGPHWVRGWNSAPTDSLSLLDPTLTPNLSVARQTYRTVVSPRVRGSQVRVHLTNEFRADPLQIESVTLGEQSTGAALTSPPTALTFGGSQQVTIPPFEEIVSDPIPLDTTAFAPLAITTYVPGSTTFLTGHWNGNAPTYYTPPGSGDHSQDIRSDAFTLSTSNDLIVSGVDVLAPAGTSAVVAFGDSITDGFVAGSIASVPLSHTSIDDRVRYPSQLQRRVNDANLPLAVVNSGQSSSKLLQHGYLPPLGRSGLSRIEDDIINVDGVRDAIILQGINDLGLPPWANATQLITGFTEVINRLHAKGIRVHLGTILPASNAIPNGTFAAPFSNTDRLTVNNWIRRDSPADTIIDFDAALRDPTNPNVLNPKYAGIDNLHPSPAGYIAMANTIDLSTLGVQSC